MAICAQCRTVFPPKRKTQRFCRSDCRTAWHNEQLMAKIRLVDFLDDDVIVEIRKRQGHLGDEVLRAGLSNMIRAWLGLVPEGDG